jgi:hypothetical protein
MKAFAAGFFHPHVSEKKTITLLPHHLMTMKFFLLFANQTTSEAIT